MKEHNKTIIDQFTKQAVPFTKIKGHYDSIDTIIEMSGVSKDNRVLDLACGTGILSCEFAKHSKNVIGIDLTQDMLTQAIKMKNEKNLDNIEFIIGDIEVLPYEDNNFEIIFSRYSFHHLLEPKKVFDEMIRVCKPHGKIIIVDVALEEKYEKAYNHMEKLRDPSHTKALTFSEFHILFSNNLLINHKQSSYKVNMELEEQLKGSFPNKNDENKIRDIFRNDLKTDLLGLNTHLDKGKIYFSYPITIFMAEKK